MFAHTPLRCLKLGLAQHGLTFAPNLAPTSSPTWESQPLGSWGQNQASPTAVSPAPSPSTVTRPQRPLL